MLNIRSAKCFLCLLLLLQSHSSLMWLQLQIGINLFTSYPRKNVKCFFIANMVRSFFTINTETIFPHLLFHIFPPLHKLNGSHYLDFPSEINSLTITSALLSRDAAGQAAPKQGEAFMLLDYSYEVIVLCFHLKKLKVWRNNMYS